MTFDTAFAIFKYSVYTLLAFNIYLFFRHATFHEGMDSIGWVMLLAVYEWETRREEFVPRSRPEKIFLIVWQIIAYGLVLYAWSRYYLHGARLDFINASLWLGVVLLIFADIYAQGEWRERWWHTAIKCLLYGALMVVAVLWGMDGDILNFYDAFLWIVCFFAVELNLLHRVRHHWHRIRKQRADK